MELHDILKTIAKSRLFLVCHENGYYLVSGTLCQRCEGPDREAASRLQNAVERIIAGHELGKICETDIEEFQKLYPQFLKKEPTYGVKAVQSAQIDLSLLLQKTGIGKAIIDQRDQFFSAEQFVVEATMQI